MIQIVNFIADHSLNELWNILLLSTLGGDVDKSFTGHS